MKEWTSKILSAMARSGCYAVLCKLRSKPMAKNASYFHTRAPYVSMLIRAGLVETCEDFATEESLYRLTELGKFVSRFISKINEKILFEERTMSVAKNKYRPSDYDSFVIYPMDVKIQRTQKAILKAILNCKVFLLNKENKESEVLTHLYNKVIEGFPPMGEIKGRKDIYLSPDTAENNPDVLKEWVVNGCYNPEAEIIYPMALWTRKNIDLYIRTILK